MTMIRATMVTVALAAVSCQPSDIEKMDCGRHRCGSPRTLVTRGEPAAVALIDVLPTSGADPAGSMSLVEANMPTSGGESSNEVRSFFPILCHSIEVGAWVDQIDLFLSRVEVRLQRSLVDRGLFHAFDAGFSPALGLPPART